MFGGDRQVPGFGRFGAGSSATPAGTSWRDIRRFFNDSAHRITNLHVYAMLAALATVLANVVVPADERREVQRLAEDILRAATRIIDTFQPNEVNEVLALVGQMGGRPPAWFLAAAAQRSTDAARQQAAAAAAGVVPAAGFEADAAQAAHVDEVLSLTAHLLTNDFTPAFEWQRSLVALSHPRLASLSPVQLAILAKACTTWSLDPFVQWWRSFLDSCQGSFELMSLEELLLVARAAAMASSTPAQVGLMADKAAA